MNDERKRHPVYRRYVFWMGKIWLLAPDVLRAARDQLAAGKPPDLYSLSDDMGVKIDIVKKLPEGAHLERLIDK
jgi:hypothetical protein